MRHGPQPLYFFGGGTGSCPEKGTTTEPHKAPAHQRLMRDCIVEQCFGDRGGGGFHRCTPGVRC